MGEQSLNSRMVALTDGVVAIAMTLLMLDIRLPEAVAHDAVTWADLWGIREKVAAYVGSFLVVGLLWLIHARRFRTLVRASALLFWLNMLFLLVIGLVPFATSLLGSSGDATAVQVYAGVMGTASLLLSGMSLHVVSAGLDSEQGLGRALTPASFLPFLTAAVFLLSILVSFWSAPAARACWLLLAVVAVADRRRAG